MNIKELAEQAGMFYMDYIRVDSMKQIERFAELVAAHEREECAKMVDAIFSHRSRYLGIVKTPEGEKK